MSFLPYKSFNNMSDIKKYAFGALVVGSVALFVYSMYNNRRSHERTRRRLRASKSRRMVHPQLLSKAHNAQMVHMWTNEEESKLPPQQTIQNTMAAKQNDEIETVDFNKTSATISILVPELKEHEHIDAKQIQNAFDEIEKEAKNNPTAEGLAQAVGVTQSVVDNLDNLKSDDTAMVAAGVLNIAGTTAAAFGGPYGAAIGGCCILVGSILSMGADKSSGIDLNEAVVVPICKHIDAELVKCREKEIKDGVEAALDSFTDQYVYLNGFVKAGNTVTIPKSKTETYIEHGRVILGKLANEIKNTTVDSYGEQECYSEYVTSKKIAEYILLYIEISLHRRILLYLNACILQFKINNDDESDNKEDESDLNGIKAVLQDYTNNIRVLKGFELLTTANRKVYMHLFLKKGGFTDQQRALIREYMSQCGLHTSNVYEFSNIPNLDGEVHSLRSEYHRKYLCEWTQNELNVTNDGWGAHTRWQFTLRDLTVHDVDHTVTEGLYLITLDDARSNRSMLSSNWQGTTVDLWHTEEGEGFQRWWISLAFNDELDLYYLRCSGYAHAVFQEPRRRKHYLKCYKTGGTCLVTGDGGSGMEQWSIWSRFEEDKFHEGWFMGWV